MPRFPAPRDQRNVAGRHYLTKAEINALYFATHKMGRPRGWDAPIRSAGTGAPPWSCSSTTASTGTVWRSTPAHEPILWRHVNWDRKSPDREAKERSPWGGLFYRRVKTDKAFYRSMNRVVHARDPGPFGRRDHISPLRAPGNAGLPSDHDSAAAESVLGDPASGGQRVPRLPETVRRHWLIRSIRPAHGRLLDEKQTTADQWVGVLRSGRGAGHRYKSLSPISGAWEVGLRRFFVRLPYDK